VPPKLMAHARRCARERGKSDVIDADVSLLEPACGAGSSPGV